MNIYITLDYELFFGTRSGTVQNCILKPTNELLNVVEKYDSKCIFFVDTGYLLKLKQYSKQFPILCKDYELITSHLRELVNKGHELQLHIHPHWEDAVFDGKSWSFDLSRYRLDAFSQIEISNIFFRYKEVLEQITSKSIFVFRAGGWCIQPFPLLKKAMIDNGIVIDSTVYYKGKNSTSTQWFDFSKAKDLDTWRFENDPCVENKKGFFLEIPIAYKKLSPLFFWKFVLVKKAGASLHKPYGDGFPSPRSNKHMIKLLFKKSYSVVSIDGYKAKFLIQAFLSYKKQKKSNFTIIGHPKSFTKYSLSRLDQFLKKTLSSNDNRVVTYNDIRKNYGL